MKFKGLEVNFELNLSSLKIKVLIIKISIYNSIIFIILDKEYSNFSSIVKKQILMFKIKCLDIY
jgi:hypothetical protein